MSRISAERLEQARRRAQEPNPLAELLQHVDALEEQLAELRAKIAADSANVATFTTLLGDYNEQGDALDAIKAEAQRRLEPRQLTTEPVGQLPGERMTAYAILDILRKAKL